MTLDDLQVEYLLCRAYGHPWENRGGLVVTLDGVRADEIRLECPLCGMKRFDTEHTRSRELLTRRYEAPDGYKLGYAVTRQEVKVVLHRKHRFAERLR